MVCSNLRATVCHRQTVGSHLSRRTMLARLNSGKAKNLRLLRISYRILDAHRLAIPSLCSLRVGQKQKPTPCGLVFAFRLSIDSTYLERSERCRFAFEPQSAVSSAEQRQGKISSLTFLLISHQDFGLIYFPLL